MQRYTILIPNNYGDTQKPINPILIDNHIRALSYWIGGATVIPNTYGYWVNLDNLIKDNHTTVIIDTNENIDYWIKYIAKIMEKEFNQEQIYITKQNIEVV